MNRLLIMLVLLLCFCCNSSLVAQDDDAVHQIFFDTLVTGEVQPTTIAVEDMKYVGNRYITRDDSALMQYAATILRNDLDFYADFSLVVLDSFYLRTYEITEMDLLGWKRMGADYVVKLEAEYPGQNLRVSWKLFETTRHDQIGRGRLEYHRTFWRELAHDIANEIVHKMTGDPGIFRTRVVYVRKVNGAKEIFISDYDGANEKQLTKTGSTNLSPSFSKDGKQVFFTSFMNDDPQLYKVHIESGRITQVGDFPGLVAAPTVSPDGNKIACVLSKDGNSEIYVLDTTGNVIKRLTRHWAIDTAPSWSPDGSKLVFASDRTGSPQLYIMSSDGLNMKRLTFQGSYNDSPIWAERGDRITFVSRTKYGRFDLASIDTDGKGYRILTQFGTNENPHFSPDGKHIIFSSNRLGPNEIFTMDFSGRNQRRLTRTGNGSNPDWGPIR